MEILDKEEKEMLSGIAKLLAYPADNLEYLYTSVKIQNKALFSDILQLAHIGIPIFHYLNQVLQFYPDQVRGYINSNKVTFQEYKQAFVLMTGEDGLFYKTA